jgi:hypothetical protein
LLSSPVTSGPWSRCGAARRRGQPGRPCVLSVDMVSIVRQGRVTSGHLAPVTVGDGCGAKKRPGSMLRAGRSWTYSKHRCTPVPGALTGALTRMGLVIESRWPGLLSALMGAGGGAALGSWRVSSFALWKPGVEHAKQDGVGRSAFRLPVCRRRRGRPGHG